MAASTSNNNTVSLKDIPSILTSINNMKPKSARRLNILIFESDFGRRNRSKLRNFSGFPFGENSQEYEDKFKYIKENFTDRSLIEIGALLGLSFSEEMQTEDIIRNLINNLIDIKLLSEKNDDEGEYDEDEDDEEDGDEDEEEDRDDDDDEHSVDDNSIHDEHANNNNKKDKQNKHKTDKSQHETKNELDNVSCYFSTIENEQRSNRCFISFKDVEDTIQTFDGKEYAVEKWVSDFEELAEILKWNEIQKYLFAKKSIKGIAKLYISSEKNINSWKKLKNALVKEFSAKISTADVHKSLMDRKMKYNEDVYEYFLVMKELASRGSIEENSLIQYVIEGIQDSPSNKIMLYGAKNLNDFKSKLGHYAAYRTDRRNNMNLSSRIKQVVSNKINNKQFNSKNQSKVNGDNTFRCFACGKLGHKANNCDSKELGVKCFKCNGFGHKSPNCKRFENSDSEKKASVSYLAIPKPNKMCKSIRINNVDISALIDTGSEINVIREDIAKIAQLSSERVPEIVLTGFGGQEIKAKEIVRSTVMIDNEYHEIKLLVVPNNAMKLDMILGIEFLNTVEMVITKDKVRIKKIAETAGIFNICIEDENELDLSHIKDEHVKEDLKALIQNYAGSKKIKTTSIETNIILKDETPIYQRARRLAPLEKRVLDEQVKKWLEEGVIIPSKSEFSSPVVIVKKKNGDYRTCIDYRRLNKQIVKDRFPMALIEDQLDKLTEAKVFSTIDLKNGFLHVPITPESTKYTAFSTPDNQYEFLKTPFGLCNSPASFGRFINEVFKELIRENVLLQYVDDLIIPSKNEIEGVKKLQRVLKVAAEYGIQINWKKCSFLKTTIEYLGYEITDSQIRPSPSKVRAVLMYPKPENVKKVQSFLGLSGYFRKFIQGYSIIAAPLIQLLKKNVPFKFGPEEETAFARLKKSLSEEPVLKLYKPSAITQVHTDASQEGIAAVLLQKDSEEDKFHPVLYMSKTNSAAERKYHSYELEVLAVVTALKKFRPYLLGISFKVITDCAAFQRTVNKAEIPNRVARWTLYLEEYDYVLEHRSSERMRHVDALSRNSVMFIKDTLTVNIAENQNKDEKLMAIKKILEIQQYGDFNLQNGIIMKYVNGKNVMVVPSNMQREIIRKLHDDGHFGAKKMKELIGREYFIDDLEKKLENHIKCCVPCILAARKQGKKEGQLYPIPKDEIPLSTLHIDHLGPMTATGKRYQYLFVVVDAFSKFTWIYPTRTTNIQEVIDRLELQAKTFGDPRRIISDRGAAFTSKEFETYCKDRSIEHLCITTGLPRGNGQVERQNQIIISVLSKLAVNDPSKWYKFVDRLQRCMNSTYQRSIGFSPYEVLVGVKMRNSPDSSILSILQEEMIKMFDDSRDYLRKLALEKITQVQSEQKRSYDKKRKEASKYAEGDLIAIKRTQFGTGMKLRHRYLGPYKVITCKGRDRYDVQKMGSGEGSKFTATSADMMKPWLAESSGTDDS